MRIVRRPPLTRETGAGTDYRWSLSALLFAGLVLLRTSEGFAQNAPLQPGTRTVTAAGFGEVKAKPDLMIVAFGIDSKGV